MENIVKYIYGNKVLDNFKLDIFQGEILSLIGLSGSGKTMLADILTGFESADSGWMIANGERFSVTSGLLKKKLKISCIRQESILVSQLSIAENILVISGSHNKHFVVNSKSIENKTKALLSQFCPDISYDTCVDDLSMAQKHIIELIKAYALGSKIIVVDNIIDSYTQKERAVLKNLIHIMKGHSISFLFLSRKPDIISDIADRVIVIRKGKNVRNIYKDEYDKQYINQLLVGSELLNRFERTSVPLDERILQVNKLSSNGFIQDISFYLNKKEILGILDVDGKYNELIVNILTGQTQNYKGDIWFKGARYMPKSLSQAIKLGMGYSPSGDTSNSLMLNMDYSKNLSLVIQKKISKSFFRINEKYIDYISKEYKAKVGVSDENAKISIKFLDAYIRKKVLLYRWVIDNSQVLVCVNPCQGSDVLMEKIIYSFLDEFVKNDKGVIVFSQNLSGLTKICDRILLNQEGKNFFEFPKHAFSDLVKVLL